MYFMSDPQALHVTGNVIPGKLGVDLHLHRVHIPLVLFVITEFIFALYSDLIRPRHIYCCDPCPIGFRVTGSLSN